MRAGENPPETGLLRNRAFQLFWWSRVVTASSFQILTVAIGWQVYALTGRVLDLGLVGLVEFLPRMLFMLPAGAAADHFARKRVLLVTRLAQASVVAVLALGAWQGWLDRNLIFLLAFVLGAARTFEMPTTQALLPQLVPAHQLPRALAAASSSLQAATILSPAVAGFLYALGAATVYGLAGALYILAAGLALRLPHIRPAPPQKALGPTDPPDRWKGLFAGITYIRHRPVILGAVSLDLFAVLLGGATALLPVIAKDILHTGPWALGMMRSAPGIGALFVSIWLARFPPRRRVGAMMFACVAVYGLTNIAFGLSHALWLTLIILAVMGGADMVSVVIRSSLIQLETPDNMRGRVSAVSGLFIGASNQLGEFESGVTASLIGTAPAVVLGGIASLAVAALWMRWFPMLAKRDTLVLPDTAAGGVAARG